MMRIICVGSIKENYLRDAISEYKKRLSKYTNLEIIECKDYEDSTKKEAEVILNYIKQKDYIVTLEIKGESLSSEDFSEFIDKTLIQNSNITFIVGGSNGLSKEVTNLSNKRLSFSNMTFPHQLFRVLLLEQIYRAFKIIKNETYHK